MGSLLRRIIGSSLYSINQPSMVIFFDSAQLPIYLFIYKDFWIRSNPAQGAKLRAADFGRRA
jgi:hypothetical protein